ncbi:MAG: hypothetical protein DWQ01_05100 [Planctomycetota bacterium]|nr:MAG: hypothetical protein DWQ01_05100 [Planctomycetota bacterium]
MTRNEEAKEAILQRVGQALNGGGVRAPRKHPITDQHYAGRPQTDLDLVSSFQEKLESVGGKVIRAQNLEQAFNELWSICQERGIRNLACSDAPSFRDLTDQAPEGLEILDFPHEQAELLEAEAGLSEAQLGIAETGTLVLDGEQENHRLTSLVPPVHIAFLSSKNIVLHLGEALSRAQQARSFPRTLTFITGPSRTADIELTLVVGVHGPRELVVFLLP